MSKNKTFETERLILKPTSEEDAAFIFDLLNTPKWLKYIGDRNIKTVESGAGLAEAARIMKTYKVNCVPVMGANGLAGLITGTDIMDAYIKLAG